MAKRVVSNSVIKTQIELDKMPPESVVLDRYGHAWQSARGYGPMGTKYATGYWYRAYGDSSEISTWELAQYGPLQRMEVAK